MRSAILFFCVCSVAFATKKTPAWQTGIVRSQDISSQRAGAYSGPVGNGTVAVPLYRHSDQVWIETERYMYGWIELGRNPIVLPVNGQIEFYQDGNRFVVLDSKRHKHKFALVRMTAKNY